MANMVTCAECVSSYLQFLSLYGGSTADYYNRKKKLTVLRSKYGYNGVGSINGSLKTSSASIWCQICATLEYIL